MTLAALVLAQLCAAAPAGGVATGEISPVDQASPGLAAGPMGVVATWAYRAPNVEGRGVTFNAVTRSFTTSLQPAGAPRVVSSDAANEALGEARASTNAAVPLRVLSGLVTLSCRMTTHFSGGGTRVNCETFTPPSGGATATLTETRDDAYVGLPRYAATTIESHAFAAVPLCGQIGVRRIEGYDTRVGMVGNGNPNAWRRGCNERAGGVEGVALTAAGHDQAALVWRQNRQLFARIVGLDEQPRGPVAALTPRADVGAPAIAWMGPSALVAFSMRANARSPYQMQLLSWPPVPGAVPSAAPSVVPSASASASPYPVPTVLTTSTDAVGPALVRSRQPGCAVLAWTEVAGHATVVRAARVCNGVVQVASIAQLSRPGVEAGESVLASDDAGAVYAAWIERPGPPSGAQLRVARLACP